MSTAGMIKVSVGCPTFDGTDYPYWKNKMRMHLEAIDNDLNCFKMHSHLILPVGVVRHIEGRTPNRDLDHTCGRHN